jgi:hypothetical protein
MKKLFIASLVGGLLLFIWQFLSWSILGLHAEMQSYTPKQEEILKALGDNLEEGFYYMPAAPPGTSFEEETKLMESSAGKPWAQVYYHKSMNTNMPLNMGRGILVDILAVLLLSWVILKMGNPSTQTIIASSLAIGTIGYLTGIYTNSIWFEYKTMADLLDTIVSWGLVGTWLAWWLRR